MDMEWVKEPTKRWIMDRASPNNQNNLTVMVGEEVESNTNKCVEARLNVVCRLTILPKFGCD
jgi:hypothetical protein